MARLFWGLIIYFVYVAWSTAWASEPPDDEPPQLVSARLSETTIDNSDGPKLVALHYEVADGGFGLYAMTALLRGTGENQSSLREMFYDV